MPLSVVPAGPAADPTDAELARALTGGQPWAAAATWNRFAPVVYGIVRRALGSQSDAEDVTQEVFFHLFARVGTLRDPASFRSFVVSFALRIVKWELRRRRARRWLMLSPSNLLPDAPGLDSDPESREVLRRFYVVLDQLAARDRLVFALRYLESMTLEEIAVALDISLSTVKRNLNRASARVSRWIAADRDLVTFFEGRRRGDGAY
ncbi:MAG TPA: sigma-70 family RNA polymerase sigma factor [Polyangia bacterium]|jgi:RNA polymerase sigma-70 factor (ECF subfamily)|nr:sigma-70 family RNA polymerase sigma factor [Polyangia bacterium]